MSAQKKDNCGNGWEVSIARTFDEVEAIRPIWEKMHNSEDYPVPNADIDRYLAVLRPQKDQMQPYVMLFRREGEPAAMVIARLEKKHKITCKVGYKVVWRPSVCALTVVYEGILGQPSNEVCAMLIEELIDALSRGEVDMLWFSQLRTNSHAYKLARKMAGVLSRSYFPRFEPHWQTLIPNHVDEFYKSIPRKWQRDIARCIRNFEKACSGSINVVCYRQEADLDHLIDVGSKISASTYKQALGVGFVNEPLTRSLLLQAAKDGWLRAYVLYAKGQPCAFEFGAQYRSIFFPEYMGFDPNWKSFNPGTILWTKVIEDLCSDPDVSLLDYGFGDALYKRKFGSLSWQEASVFIFAPRLYPVLVNLADSSIRGLSLGLAFLANKLDITTKVKRHWRDYLQRTQHKKNQKKSGNKR
jgi:hypothetical protein